MNTYEVSVTIVRNVEAESPAEALTQLCDKLREGLGIPKGQDSLGAVESNVRFVQEESS